MRGIKKISVLISCLMITIILLCSCGFSKPIPKQLRVSNGMKKLAEKTVDSFDDYSNAKKGKKAYLKNMQDIHEQKEDLYTPSSECPGDYYIDELIDEVYVDSISDSADKEDIKVPIEDISKVLDGTYNYKKEILTQSCENDDLSFYLPKSWEKGEDSDGSTMYSHTNKKGDIVMLLPVSDTTEDNITMDENTDEMGSSKVAENLGLEKANLKYTDMFQTRKLNYFYIYTGKIKGKKGDTNVLVGVTVKIDTGYTSLSHKNYYFVFLSDGKFEKSKIYEILQNVENAEGENVFDVDDKYDEYFEKH